MALSVAFDPDGVAANSDAASSASAAAASASDLASSALVAASGAVKSGDIRRLSVMTSSAYAALSAANSSTAYFIVD